MFDCSVRDFNLSQAQVFFDMGSNWTLGEIGKDEGDRFQQLLKEMVDDMQEQEFIMKREMETQVLHNGLKMQ